MVHRKQLSSNVAKPLFQLQIKLLQQKNIKTMKIGHSKKKTILDIQLQLGRAKVTCVVLL